MGRDNNPTLRAGIRSSGSLDEMAYEDGLDLVS